MAWVNDEPASLVSYLSGAEARGINYERTQDEYDRQGSKVPEGRRGNLPMLFVPQTAAATWAVIFSSV